MKNKLVRMKSQVLFSLTLFTLTIVPVTSTFAILPMASEIFQSESSFTASNDKKILTADAVFSNDNSVIIENYRIIASSDRAISSNYIKEQKHKFDLKNKQPLWNMIELVE